jgi:Tfp pilus assembly protein PilX
VENEFLYAKRSLDTGSPAECNVELAGGVCFAGQDFTTLGGWAQHKVYRIALYGDPGSPWYKVEELPAISSTASLGTNFKGSGTDTSNNMKPYRITALGSDAADPATDSSVVVLQSVVVVQ